MQLRRYESGLLLHERRIGLPGFQKSRLIRLVQTEEIHQHDRAGVERDLALDRK